MNVLQTIPCRGLIGRALLEGFNLPSSLLALHLLKCPYHQLDDITLKHNSLEEVKAFKLKDLKELLDILEMNKFYDQEVVAIHVVTAKTEREILVQI